MLQKYKDNLYAEVGDEIGTSDWFHNYYKFNRIMVSVFSENAFENKFSIKVMHIKDLRKKINWSGKTLLQYDDVPIQVCMDVLDKVLNGELT